MRVPLRRARARSLSADRRQLKKDKLYDFCIRRQGPNVQFSTRFHPKERQQSFSPRCSRHVIYKVKTHTHLDTRRLHLITDASKEEPHPATYHIYDLVWLTRITWSSSLVKYKFNQKNTRSLSVWIWFDWHPTRQPPIFFFTPIQFHKNWGPFKKYSSTLLCPIDFNIQRLIASALSIIPSNLKTTVRRLSIIHLSTFPSQLFKEINCTENEKRITVVVVAPTHY